MLGRVPLKCEFLATRKLHDKLMGRRNAWLKQQTAMMRNDLNLVGIRTPLMRHRGRAWGLVLEHESGWKISSVAFRVF
jgi:hypothetical protein